MMLGWGGGGVSKAPLPHYSEVSIFLIHKAMYKITEEEWHVARSVGSIMFARPHSEQKATQPTTKSPIWIMAPILFHSQLFSI